MITSQCLVQLQYQATYFGEVSTEVDQDLSMEAFNELIQLIHLLVVEPIYHAHHTVAAMSTGMRERLTRDTNSQKSVHYYLFTI